MNRLAKLWSRENRSIISNPHFWAILFLVCVFTSLYYAFEHARFALHDWVPWFRQVIIFEFGHGMNGILFYIPVCYAALVFSWRGVVVVWLVSMIMVLPHVILFSPATIYLISNLLYLFIPLIVLIIISLERRWRERFRKTIAERESERQTYMSQILEAQENERKRIARELHDDTTQSLLVIANRAQSLLNDSGFKVILQVREQVEWIRNEVLNLMENVRRLSLDLRPSILDDLGLLSALRWLVNRLTQEGAIDAKIAVEGLHRKLTPEISNHLFRIAQEALSNVRHHSEATQVVVTLEFTPETIKLTVRDNGKGFLLQDISKWAMDGKLGMIGIQERIRLLNGFLNIDSEPGKGTTMSVECRD